MFSSKFNYHSIILSILSTQPQITAATSNPPCFLLAWSSVNLLRTLLNKVGPPLLPLLLLFIFGFFLRIWENKVIKSFVGWLGSFSWKNWFYNTAANQLEEGFFGMTSKRNVFSLYLALQMVTIKQWHDRDRREGYKKETEKIKKDELRKNEETKIET